MEKIYGKHKLVGLQLFLSGTPTFSRGTPTFCQMGVLNSCFQNPGESSATLIPSLKKIGKKMPKIESENQFLTSIKGPNSVLICPAESENDALTDGLMYVQRAVLTGHTF